MSAQRENGVECEYNIDMHVNVRRPAPARHPQPVCALKCVPPGGPPAVFPNSNRPALQLPYKPNQFQQLAI